MICLSIIQSSLMFVRLRLKISVTTEPIGFYSLGDISTDPVVVKAIFLGVQIPTPPPKKKKKKKIPPPLGSYLSFLLPLVV